MRKTAVEIGKFRADHPERVEFEQRFWQELADAYEAIVPAARADRLSELLDPDEVDRRALLLDEYV
jgi:hypothetical protein